MQGHALVCIRTGVIWCAVNLARHPMFCLTPQDTASPACWGLTSAVQLSVGVIVPHALVFILDLRAACKHAKAV